MPVGIVSGPVTKASFEPLVVSFTACPTAQAPRADWMAEVSRLVSLGTPPEGTLCVAVSVAHAAGIVGSGGRFVSPAPQVPGLPPPLPPASPPASTKPPPLPLPLELALPLLPPLLALVPLEPSPPLLPPGLPLATPPRLE